MVTFSAVFLLKVAVNWNSAYLSIDGRQVRRLVRQVIELMSCVSAGEKHLTRHIARGLGKILERFDAWETAFHQPAVGSSSNTLGKSTVVDSSGEEKSAGTPVVAALGGFPPPELIYNMVGSYGFGLDESLLDPSLSNLEFWG